MELNKDAYRGMTKGYKQTELGIIPADWEIVELVKLTTRIGDGIHTTPQYSDNGDYYFVNGNNLVNGKIVISEETKKVSNEEYLLHKRDLSDDTVLLSINGTIGNIAFYLGENIVLGKSAAYININDKLDKKFFYQILQAAQIRKYFENELTGSTIKNLGLAVIRNTPIPLPPKKNEQIAIATALSDIDELISQTEKLIDKKNAIKQGVMQELLKPKEGWVTKKLDDIAIFRRGSFPQPYGLDKWYDDISGKPFVQVYDVDDNKKLKTETKRYISSEAQQMSVLAKEGTIVLTIQGSIGRIAITQYDAYIDRTLLIFESYKYDFDKYFFMHTIHQLFELEKQNAPGGIIKTITKEALRNFKISYPDFAEQKNIGITISDLEKEIILIESKLKKQKQQKQGIMQVLLTGKIRLI